MKTILTKCDAYIGPWLNERLGDHYAEGAATYIGLLEDSKLIAAVKYDGFNRANINMHVAAEPGKYWLTREFLWFTFYYPFEQLQCTRITALVAESNLEARKFDKNLGFVFEAALKDAHPDGDLLVYAMFKRNCRWLNLKRPNHAPQLQEISLPSVRLHSVN